MSLANGRCDRCGETHDAMIVSFFNTDWICLECEAAEKAHPKYAEARYAELSACKRGEFNFPGVGLPADFPR